MQIWSSVNENDIGSIRQGQPVRFTVGAQAGQTFEGEGLADPPERQHDLQRGDVYRGGHGGEPRRQTLALPDGPARI